MRFATIIVPLFAAVAMASPRGEHMARGGGGDGGGGGSTVTLTVTDSTGATVTITVSLLLFAPEKYRGMLWLRSCARSMLTGRPEELYT